MAKITKQKCNNCLKVHPMAVDVCDSCGSTSFTPFSDKEKVVTIGDVVRAKEHKLTKEAAHEVIGDDKFAVVNGNAVQLDTESEEMKEAVEKDQDAVGKKAKKAQKEDAKKEKADDKKEEEKSAEEEVAEEKKADKKEEKKTDKKDKKKK